MIPCSGCLGIPVTHVCRSKETQFDNWIVADALNVFLEQIRKDEEKAVL